MLNKQYTPYDDVNAILEPLLVGAKQILKEKFAGMYLYGSLATGDFDEHSDIDVLVVAKDAISESMFAALQAMHDRIATFDSPWAIQMEVTYLAQNALRRSGHMLHPYLDRGPGERLHWRHNKSDWNVERHILREKGVTLEGPGPHTLIDSVSADELRGSVVDVLPLWVDPLLDDPAQQIKPRGYQSFIVLSLCRMLYTLQHGAIVSKRVAAEWALSNLNAHWRPLIERAIAGRQNAGHEVKAEDLNGTQDFMRYTLKHSRPTLYFSVNQILHLLLADVKEILGDEFVGMYLYGSLSSGDFNPKSSDIDFLVVTSNMLSENTVAELDAMHNRIWASGLKWASKLEGLYLPVKALRRYEPSEAKYPTINESRFCVDLQGSDWVIQRHVIREHGVVLEGPDPKSMIDPVSPYDIRQSVLNVLHEWWFPMLDDPSWLRDHESGDRAFAVITMCRALHALKHGTIVSKPVATKWAQDELGSPWKALIEKAIAAQDGNGDEFLNETLDFIRYTLNAVRPV